MTPDPATGATLSVVDPNGRRVKVPIYPFPFRMGRSPDNNLVLRDTRISRNHAQICLENGRYVLEDLASRHGVWVNGARIQKSRPLEGSEKIEFGVPDGYQLHFSPAGKVSDTPAPIREKTLEAVRSGTTNLEKLRAVLEVARSLQSSFSTDEVLNTVLDAALAVTGAERGFLLLLDENHELQVRSTRSRTGGELPPDDLRVPRRLILQALESRRDLFSMSFDPTAADGVSPGTTIMDLELRSVVCVPLVRVNLSGGGATQMLTAAKSSVGILYMDSRVTAVDLAGGNRELLQTLAIEASTVLENARLLEEERARQKMEEELDVARRIQQGLLPRSLPSTGWFVVHGSSEATHQVGGDYFDVLPIGPDTWSMVVADVSGKGVSSALLASFLQGAFLSASCNSDIGDMLSRLNRFLSDRADHGKYATLFYSKLDSAGKLTYANAGHCAPLLVHAGGAIEKLEATGPPVGLIESAVFGIQTRGLAPGDRLVLYSDGVTEAQDPDGEFYGRRRLRQTIDAAPDADSQQLHEAIRRSLLAFTRGAEQSDDVTLVVMEYRGNR